MNDEATATMIKMLESVPDALQEQVVEHMRDYIDDISDEAKWKKSFSKTQDKLIAAAHRVRREIIDGKAVPMDYDKL